MADAPSSPRARILVVDDEASLRRIAQYRLAEAGYEVALAEDGAKALDALSESLRTTMVLACVEQLPYKDIAQVLGCSEGTVAWRVHEARRKLREAIGDDVLLAFEEP